METETELKRWFRDILTTNGFPHSKIVPYYKQIFFTPATPPTAPFTVFNESLGDGHLLCVEISWFGCFEKGATTNWQDQPEIDIDQCNIPNLTNLPDVTTQSISVWFYGVNMPAAQTTMPVLCTGYEVSSGLANSVSFAHTVTVFVKGYVAQLL